MITSVAVIGVGSLGAPIARRLHEAGFELTVCDLNPKALEAFAASGVRTTTTPSECGGADLIILLVATPAQAREAVLGERGVVRGLPTGARPLMAVSSTVSRDAILELASSASAFGIRALDVPVSGGPPRALNGTLTVLVAGDKVDSDEARPVLAALGTLYDCGELGNAQALKLVNNVVCAANFAITGEAYRLALECGLSLEDVTAVLDVSTGRNFVSPDAGTATAYLREWTQSPEVFESTLSIVRKDVALAIEMAAESSGAYVGLSGLSDLLASLGSETYEDWRVAAGDVTTDSGE